LRGNRIVPERFHRIQSLPHGPLATLPLLASNTIICAIVVVMLASTVVVAKPRNHQSNGQTREQYCRQLVGPEKGEGEAGKTATMRSQIMRWDDCMMQRSPNP
jgi:hypothetical protein